LLEGFLFSLKDDVGCKRYKDGFRVRAELSKFSAPIKGIGGKRQSQQTGCIEGLWNLWSDKG